MLWLPRLAHSATMGAMLTIAIQAGGRSSRMGRDKGLVPLAGKPLIEHVLERLAGLSDSWLVTTNAPEAYAYLGLPLARDETPGAGALAGLRTALRASPGERVLLVACDMPFLQRPLVERLLAEPPSTDVIVPIWRGRHQPLLAIYRRRCLPAIEQALASSEMAMVSFFDSVEVCTIAETEVARWDPDGLSFININTPEELADAERRLAEKAGPAVGGPEDADRDRRGAR